MTVRNNVSGVSGNANTLVAGSLIAGSAIFMGGNVRKVAFLSALVSVTPATATLTFSGKWQVSNDNTTWIDATPPNNAANVTLATGTATIVTKTFEAPEAVYGWRYSRFSLVTGVATGAAGDLYSIAYSYRQLTGSDAVS